MSVYFIFFFFQVRCHPLKIHCFLINKLHSGFCFYVSFVASSNSVSSMIFIHEVGEQIIWLSFARNSARVGSNFVVIGRFQRILLRHR